MSFYTAALIITDPNGRGLVGTPLFTLTGVDASLRR